MWTTFSQLMDWKRMISGPVITEKQLNWNRKCIAWLWLVCVATGEVCLLVLWVHAPVNLWGRADSWKLGWRASFPARLYAALNTFPSAIELLSSYFRTPGGWASHHAIKSLSWPSETISSPSPTHFGDHSSTSPSHPIQHRRKPLQLTKNCHVAATEAHNTLPEQYPTIL